MFENRGGIMEREQLDRLTRAFASESRNEVVAAVEALSRAAEGS